MSRTLSEIPVTVAGIRAAMESRRDEAKRAIEFLRDLEALDRALATSSHPWARPLSRAAETAREQAVEAVILWRSAVAELRRLAEAEGVRP